MDQRDVNICGFAIPFSGHRWADEQELHTEQMLHTVRQAEDGKSVAKVLPPDRSPKEG